MGGAKIAEMTGFLGYENTGGRGAYIILDKNTGDKLKLPIYPVPNNRYMGVHVTPTTDGNVIVGPTRRRNHGFVQLRSRRGDHSLSGKERQHRLAAYLPL